MVDYIGSKTIKKYYEEKGITIPDRMIAARICNAGFTMEEIYSSLREIQESTEDIALKEQIQKYIDRERKKYDAFKRSFPGDVYRLYAWYKGDDDYWEEGVYSDFELAFSVIHDIKEKEGEEDKGEQYKIEKFHVVGRDRWPLTEEEHRTMTECAGRAVYDGEGALYYVDSVAWEEYGEDDYEHGKTFDTAYYYYPNPFKRGDILVQRGDEDHLYIVNLNSDPEKEAEREQSRASWGDFLDIGLYLPCIDRRTGRIWDSDEPVHPYALEYADIDENTEDIVEQAALEIQNIMRGARGSLQFIYDVCVRKKEDRNE